jgi:uncharacterized damage-inducible protein DinB
MITQTATPEATVLTSKMLLHHWQGHRGLTRKLIEAYPEDKLFSYSIGGMRPFGELIAEILTMAAPGIEGVATGNWPTYQEVEKRFSLPCTKAQLLAWWDEATEKINTLWPQIEPERWQQVDKAFGMWEGPMYWSVQYFIDNEIHHRGQGYVYLRSLGIEPPAFWDRK